MFADEGPETGDDSDEDIVRSYLPGGVENGGHGVADTNHNIPAINITLHSPNSNHVLGKYIIIFGYVFLILNCMLNTFILALLNSLEKHFCYSNRKTV